jgi:hypothetical protein
MIRLRGVILVFTQSRVNLESVAHSNPATTCGEISLGVDFGRRTQRDVVGFMLAHENYGFRPAVTCMISFALLAQSGNPSS